MTVETIFEEARWRETALDRLAGRASDATLARLGLDPEAWEISLLACDDARIAVLNDAFRGRPQPTNVLSWPSAERAAAEDGGRPAAPDPQEPDLGDIAIAFETCSREAEAAGIGLAAHATHLVVHGVLHLLGYDHETDADAARMEALEIEILASLGVANPY